MITELDIPHGANALTVFEDVNGTALPVQTIKLSDNSRAIKIETVEWEGVERRDEMRRISSTILDDIKTRGPISEAIMQMLIGDMSESPAKLGTIDLR
jgi:hypothetical protein